MRHLLFSFSVLCAFSLNAQSLISSVNAGGLSNNNMIFSVGEIYVLPISNPNEANAGLIGVVSRLQLVSGVDDVLVSDDLRAFPNPTNHSLCLETSSEWPISSIQIFDMMGKCVAVKAVNGGPIDVSELPSGTYIIQADVKSILPFKIIKQ